MFVFVKSSINMSDLVSPEYQGCVNGALMDGFSVFIQALLAVLAFSTLMCKFVFFFTFKQTAEMKLCFCVVMCSYRLLL